MKTKLVMALGALVCVAIFAGAVKIAINNQEAGALKSEVAEKVLEDTSSQKLVTVAPQANGKVFLIGGTSFSPSVVLNDVWYSFDAINWSVLQPNAPWPARAHFATGLVDNKLWVIGGVGNTGYLQDVWGSSDGYNWIQHSIPPWSPREIFAHEVFSGKIWLIGGHKNPPYVGNEIWNYDGTTWTHFDNQLNTPGIQDAPWPSTYIFTGAIVFNNKLFAISGLDGNNNYLNEIWSFDGVNWTQVDTNTSIPGIQNAPWSARVYPGLSVLNNRIYLTGGITKTTGIQNDVWSSLDGITWTQATPSSPWPARAGHKLVNINNNLFILGGGDFTQYFNDIWSTSGFIWGQQSNATWQPRQGHQIVLTPTTFGQCEIRLDNTILPSYILSTGTNKTIARLWVRGCNENTTLRQLTYQISRQPTSYSLSNIRLFQGTTPLVAGVPVTGTTIPTYTFTRNLPIPASPTTQIFDIKADITGTLVAGSSRVTTTLLGIDIIIPGQSNAAATTTTLPLPPTYLKY